MSALYRFLRTWMLAVAILLGVTLYFVGNAWLPTAAAQAAALKGIKTLQPILIFVMLTITFCKVDPKSLRWERWHFWLLLLQSLGFGLSALALFSCDASHRPIAEGALLCFICPTATSAAVITGKLKGDMAGVISYTMLANLLAAVLIPTVVSLALPTHEPFVASLWRIVGKVFPMLICPFFVAWGIRAFLPRLLSTILQVKDLAFYIWAICLTLAITTSTHALMHTSAGTFVLWAMGGVTFGACVLQFALGRLVGAHYGSKVAASQGIGQKNTVFAIWAGYTFFDPISTLAGGFYSIFHNVWNSWQLSQMVRREESA